MKNYLPLVKGITCGAFLLLSTTTSYGQASSAVLEEWPFTTNDLDSTTVRATGVAATVPTLQHLYTSNGTQVTAVTAYSPTNGQALSAGNAGTSTPGDGRWGTTYGGPGGSLNRNIYEQFQIAPTTGNSLRVDSLILNAAFYGSSSGTTMMAVYSLSNFVADSANIYGYTFASGGAISLTQVNTAPLPTYRLALVGGGSGVTVPAGDTLSIRVYFTCTSSSAGRYAEVMDVIAEGAVTSSAPCLSQPAAFNTITATLCAGQNSILYSVPAVTNATSYTWTYSGTGATFSSTTDSVTINYANTATSGTLSVVANASCGSSPARTASITVNALPTNAITTSVTTPAICPGSGLTLTASAATGNTYQWFLNTSAISGATNGTYTATAAGSYTVKIINSGSCTDTSAALVVTTSSVPTATVTTAGSATSFCPGTSLVISANSGTGYTYQWQNNATNVSNTALNDTVSAAGAYRVIVTNASGCKDTSTAVTITAGALPGDTISTGGPLSFCAGNTVAVTLNVTSSAGASYQWLKNGSIITGAITQTFLATVAGSYTVKVTGADGCTDTSAATVVVVHPLPVPVLTETAKVLSVGSYTLYQWSYNGASITQTSSTLDVTIHGNGVYTVTVTDANGCTATSAPDTVKDAVGVPMVQGIGSQVKLYPNPANDVVYLDAPLAVNVTIAGMDGRVVLHKDGANNININGLAKGIYMVLIYDENNILIKTDKLVKN